jgi:hypothetical protein
MNEKLMDLVMQTLPMGKFNRDDVFSGHINIQKLADAIIDECLNVIDAASGVGDDDVIQIERDVERAFGRDTTSKDEYLKGVGRGYD